MQNFQLQDIQQFETTFAILVVAGVVWVLLMIFAVVLRVFKELLVLAIIGGSAAFAAPVAMINMWLLGKTWYLPDFIFYFVFYWLCIGVLMTIFPVVHYVRRHFF
jgi:hypothetical protein